MVEASVLREAPTQSPKITSVQVQKTNLKAGPLVILCLFFGPSPLPFGGSTVLETYSSTSSHRGPVPGLRRHAAPYPGGIDPRLGVFYARS